MDQNLAAKRARQAAATRRWYNRNRRGKKTPAKDLARIAEWKRKNRNRARVYRARHGDKIAAYKKRWRDANPLKAQFSNANRYGVTPSFLEALHHKQGGCCRICGRRRKLEADHCHATGLLRGLVCRPCNHGLGSLQDSPQLLRAAAEYAERCGGFTPGLLAGAF